jgi:dipeptidyl aminopeptidase/acylaminoacyl peptidase
VIRQIPRQGIISQLVWSPDGKAFVGTANGLGPFWNIGRLEAATGAIQAISETERYNCTPDWSPDARQILYARGIIPEKGGRAELWAVTTDGQSRRMLYAEAGRHIYGGCSAPDGKYVLFTRSVEDLGKVDNSRTTMALARWDDTPMIGDSDAALLKRFPNARTNPRLDLGPGWEPHWTYADITPPKKGRSK